MAVELGADAIGFVLECTSPRHLEASAVNELAKLAGPYCTTVAVYGRTSEPFPRTSAVQAVEFRSAPVRTCIQVIRLGKDAPIDAGNADAILLDAYSPDAFGGTGEKVDWERAVEIVRSAKKPVILAGGLNPSNIAEAIALVRPYGVDVSSGIESAPGKKDPSMMRDFIQAVRAAG